MKFSVAIVGWLALLIASSAVAAATSVRSVAGNVVLEQDGKSVQLTTSGRDVEPVLSPDGGLVVYTRLPQPPGTDTADVDCSAPATSDAIRMIKVDGSGDRPIVAGHAADQPEAQLCGFQAKQFSSSGSRLYFLSTAWATSGALHAYDFGTGKEHYLLPANDLVVLAFCTDDNRDALAVEQHRYFVFGGSYDWYWLYDPTGTKEIGPVGDLESSDQVAAQAHDWCAG